MEATPDQVRQSLHEPPGWATWKISISTKDPREYQRQDADADWNKVRRVKGKHKEGSASLKQDFDLASLVPHRANEDMNTLEWLDYLDDEEASTTSLSEQGTGLVKGLQETIAGIQTDLVAVEADPAVDSALWGPSLPRTRPYDFTPLRAEEIETVRALLRQTGYRLRSQMNYPTGRYVDDEGRTHRNMVQHGEQWDDLVHLMQVLLPHRFAEWVVHQDHFKNDLSPNRRRGRPPLLRRKFVPKRKRGRPRLVQTPEPKLEEMSLAADLEGDTLVDGMKEEHSDAESDWADLDYAGSPIHDMGPLVRRFFTSGDKGEARQARRALLAFCGGKVAIWLRDMMQEHFLKLPTMQAAKSKHAQERMEARRRLPGYVYRPHRGSSVKRPLTDDAGAAGVQSKRLKKENDGGEEVSLPRFTILPNELATIQREAAEMRARLDSEWPTDEDYAVLYFKAKRKEERKARKQARQESKESIKHKESEDEF